MRPAIYALLGAGVAVGLYAFWKSARPERRIKGAEFPMPEGRAH